MAASTGPVLALGAITIANQSLLHDRPVDLRVALATGLAAGMFYLVEKVNAPLAVGLAWTALVAVLLTRMDPSVPSPTETLLEWWEKK